MMILQQTRGGLSSGDQCSLDIPFAVTKSLAARIGPTPTFTRASAATFIDSDGLIQTATINTPRFDHDPVTLACRGLLIEEGRTNLIFPSATLFTQTRTVTAVAHTLSFYGSGTIVLSGTHSATVVGAGAYPARRTLTFTPTAGSLTLAVTGTVEFAQLEAGSFASSYIPTTTTTAVRSADVCSITGANFTSFCNQTEGTLSLESTILASTSSMGGVILSAADRFNCSIAILKNNSTTSNANVVFPYNSYSANFNIANTTYGAESKTIIAFKQDNFAASSNGSTVLTDNAGTFVTGKYPLNQMQIGISQGTRMFGWISEIKYYRKRLPNAKIQALSA